MKRYRKPDAATVFAMIFGIGMILLTLGIVVNNVRT